MLVAISARTILLNPDRASLFGYQTIEMMHLKSLAGQRKKLLGARYQLGRDFIRTGRLQSETVPVMGRYTPSPGLLNYADIIVVFFKTESLAQG